MIYLDNAATTFPKPEVVLKALDNANRNAFNTGRGSYKVARDSSKIIDEVREKLLKLIKCPNGEVVFTPSATYALNDLIFGIDFKQGDNIYISPFEHNSIIRALEQLKREKNINIYTLPFDKKDWSIDEEITINMFTLNKPKAIFVSHVSNVTGYVLPYNRIFELSKKYNSINILDASQSYGIVEIKDLSNINYIVFAGHKSLYASFGIAGFIKLKNDKLDHFIYGGTGSDTMNPLMPEEGSQAYEAGSPNIVAITGLNASIDWINKTEIYNHEKELTDYLIKELKKIRKVNLYIPDSFENIFGVVSFSVEGYESDEVGKILDDEYNICVRTGYHCAPLVHDFINSIGYNGTIRCSLSYFTTEEEIKVLLEALKTL